MKRIETIIRNQKLIEMFVRLICDHEKLEKVLYYCSEEFGIKSSTIESIISNNQRFYKKMFSKFNKCPIKLKRKK